MKNLKIAVLVASMVLMSGCQSTSKSPLEELAANDVVVGTGAGAAIGAIIGGLVDGEKGAKRGALLGAGVGFIAGNVAKKRRENFASDAEFLDAEIASANVAITTKEQQLMSLESEIRASKEQIETLKQQIKQNESVGPQLQSLYTNLEVQLEQNQNTSKKYQQSLDYLESVLSKTNIEAAKTAQEKEALVAKVDSLSTKRKDLAAQMARLNGVNEEILEQQQTLIALSNQQGTTLTKGKS